MIPLIVEEISVSEDRSVVERLDPIERVPLVDFNDAVAAEAGVDRFVRVEPAQRPSALRPPGQEKLAIRLQRHTQLSVCPAA